MKRILSIFALTGMAVGVGCGGGPGTTNQTLVDDVAEGPAAGGEQPVNDTERPPPSITTAPESTFGDRPASNPFQPPTNSSGGIDCDALCGLLICSEDVSVDECLSQCRSAAAEIDAALQEFPCLEEAFALFDCLIARGFDCEEITEEDALACSPDAEAAIECIEEFENVSISVDQTPDGPPRDGPPDIPTGEFVPCPDGSGEIPAEWFCDNEPDCDDGSDEEFCSSAN